MSVSDFFSQYVFGNGVASGAAGALSRLLLTGVQLAVLIVALMLIRLCFRRSISPTLRYSLWFIVAVRALLPVRIESALSLFNLFGSRADAAAYSAASAQSVPAALEQTLTQTVPGALADNPAMPAAINAAPTAAKAALGWTDIALIVWLCGVGLMLLYTVFVNLRFHLRVRRDMRPIERPGCPLPVYMADIPSPCLMLVEGKPSIIMNGAALSDGCRADMVMRHELAHHRRGDMVWAAVRALVTALWWFHPLVWAAALICRRDCELAADEYVMRDMDAGARKEYGRALVSMVGADARQSLVCATTAMTGAKREMKERIMNIAKKPKPLVAAVIVTLLLCAAVCATACTAPSPADGGEPPTENGVSPTGQTDAPGEQISLAPDGDNAPIVSPDPEAKYTVTLYTVGEVTARSNIYAATSSATADIESAIMDSMVRSAAWPTKDLPPLDAYFDITQRFDDGTTSTYRVFLSEDGAPCMASGELWTFLSVESYDSVAAAAGAEPLSYPGPAEAQLTFEDGGKDTPLATEEQAISEAVKATLRTRVGVGDHDAEAHETLYRTEEGDTVTLGLIAMYGRFGSNDWVTAPGLVRVSGTVVTPMKVTLGRADGLYSIASVQLPRDGSLYELSLRDMFPADCVDKALDYGEAAEQQLITGLLEAARQWSEDRGFSPTLFNFDYYYGPAETDARVSAMIEEARTLLGKPYEVNADGPDSFGPAGLLTYLLRRQGYTLGKKTCATLSEKDSWARIEDIYSVKPGDLLFFTGSDGLIQHAGLYIGEGEFIHASASNGSVVVSRLGAGGGTYWDLAFSHALRWWQ